MERWAARELLRALGSPPIRIVLASGEEVTASQSEPVARVILHDRATLWSLVTRPRLSFGEAYGAGRLEVEGSLLDLLIAVYHATAAVRKPGKLPRVWIARLGHWLESNTLDGSKRHIHHHYDIGNDFYKLWLDREMVYTCAYFPEPSVSLEEAQLAKMDHVSRKLWLRPGETVVEAGCGWGALALHMARYYGVTVKAFNISHEQVAYARHRAKVEGLASRVEFIEDDYRNIKGKFEAFVSVGMLEHVGPDHYFELGRTIDRVLGPTGRGLIHSIGQNCSGILINPWIRRRIFPGAYPPGLKEITSILEPWRFSVLDVENLRLHYAQTLRHWLARFDAAEQRVREMFDPTFVRMWRFYLTGSTAAFLAGEMQLFQVVFARPQLNTIPWTRAAIYQPLPALACQAMVLCDILIVGGGPAGSSCAKRLCAAGFDVLVLDKADFPRDKVCAGWITPAVLDSLDLDPAEYAQGRVLQPITAFRVGRWGGPMVEIEYGEPVSYGIRRCEFDHYLFSRCGARLQLGESLRSLVRDGDGWVVNDRYRAAMLVGAGGHFCPVAQRLAADAEPSPAVVAAQEIEFLLSDEQQNECQVEGRRPELYFCGDLAGYGWCFRKGSHLNVGLGREDRQRLPEHVSDFCQYLQEQGRIPRSLPGKFHGHAYLLYQHSLRQPVHDRALLIGDAAGLAYTESGEGIRPAIESGLMAAEVIEAAANDYSRERLEPYRKHLETRFGRRHRPVVPGSRVPSRLRQLLGAWLLARPWFVRRVVVQRWFLHSGQPAFL